MFWQNAQALARTNIWASVGKCESVYKILSAVRIATELIGLSLTQRTVSLSDVIAMDQLERTLNSFFLSLTGWLLSLSN